MKNVQSLSQLISIQSGSIVSKEIINKPTGTITLFAFDKGQGLSEHTAPYDALAFVVEGEVEIIVSKIKYQVKKGEMLLMPANDAHSLKASEPLKLLLTMIKS